MQPIILHIFSFRALLLIGKDLRKYDVVYKEITVHEGLFCFEFEESFLPNSLILIITCEVAKSAPPGGRQKRPDSTDSVFLPNGEKGTHSASPDARITGTVIYPMNYIDNNI